MQALSYSIPGFVAATGVGRSTVYKEIAAGRLKTVKVGSRTIITADAGRAWLDQLAAEKAQHGGEAA